MSRRSHGWRHTWARRAGSWQRGAPQSWWPKSCEPRSEPSGRSWARRAMRPCWGASSAASASASEPCGGADRGTHHMPCHTWRRMHSDSSFDVIVIGGGHAGSEAALAAARMGCRTLLLTQSIETLGAMSCNPAIGGIGKGHLVREIDALGGAMARAADRAGIQFRTLNASKGPAVRATRAQADRQLYRQAIRGVLENQPNLLLFQQEVADVVVEGERVCGVVTVTGIAISARA